MRLWISILLLAVLASCNSQKPFTDYEISYARHGGYAPMYENLFIDGNSIQYFFEGNGQKYSKKSRINKDEKQALLDVINKNKLQTVREDYKKFYDRIATTVKVKNLNTIKTDGSDIMPQDRQRWQNIVQAFEALIVKKDLRKKP